MFFSKVFAVIKFYEVFVIVVGADGVVRVFNWAPVPFGASGNFAGIGKYTVGVVAVKAVDLLHQR
jgi:hypothetical protein